MPSLPRPHAFALFACVFLASAPAAAQSLRPLPVGPVVEACAADLQAHCARTSFAYGAVAKCLREAREKLTPACLRLVEEGSNQYRKARETLRPASAAVRTACLEDWNTHCGTVARGAARSRCIRGAEDKFSATCKTALEDLRKLRRQLATAEPPT